MIPDSVRDLCDCCFKECRNLGRVISGSSSSLESISNGWINETKVENVSIPDDVRKLCGRCFAECRDFPGVLILVIARS